MDDEQRCPGQPAGEPSCSDKIAYWMRRHREACIQLEEANATIRRQEAVLVAADRVREAYDAMIEGRPIGNLPEWQRPVD